MPLSKARDRERKRLQFQPNSNLKTEPQFQPKQAKLDELRQLIKGIEVKSGLETNTVQPNIPWYNPAIHKAGDTVRIRQGASSIITTVPAQDADGYILYD